MRVADVWARAVSVVFHPLFIPTLGMFILFRLNSYVAHSLTVEARRFILLLVFVNTAIAPVLAVVLLKRFGHINDWLLQNRAERILPLMISSVMFLLTYYMLFRLPLPSLIYFYVMGGTLLVLMALLVSFFWKISIHTMSMGGLVGFLVVASILLSKDLSLLIVMALLASGLTASARIQLKAHTPAQVYAGFVAGFAGMWVLFLYLMP